MAYGSDITEGLPYNLSNPVGIITYAGSNEAYDIALSGQPFFTAVTDETPYRRNTAQYRKQQIDQTNEPGEQSITGWWVRAQSSFHGGAGIKYYDPSAGESVAYRFADSQGVNVWEKGQVTLLNDVTEGHVTTGTITANLASQQHLRSIQYSGTDALLLHDEYDVDKISSSGTVTHFVDYNSGVNDKVFAICDDGQYAYWITNDSGSGSGKLQFWKKLLTGVAGTGDVLMFSSPSITVTNACMEYVKDRIIAVINNSTYEVATNATSLPTAIYTNPNTNWIATSVTASGPAIYISGNSGIYGSIHKYTLTTAGAMPTLTSAVVAAELPPGEIIMKIFYYLGYMMIGTTKGARAALVNDQDGSLGYGPLIFESDQAVYDFAARDRFIWCASGITDLQAGVIRIDLAQSIENEPLRFAYANDLQYAIASNHPTTSVAFVGSTNQLAFTTAYKVNNGAVYLENMSSLVPSGYITTGRIRYATLENKVFKLMKALVDNTNGAITIQSIDSASNYYTIGSFSLGDFTPETNVSYPAGPQQYLSFKFTIARNPSTVTKGAILNGFQLKSLPAIPRQRLIQYPLACYDREMDSLGVQVGHEGAAYEKLIALEELESAGDTIRVEDFRTGESYLGLIEEIQFINRTPSDKRFSGFGGILLVTVRTI
jgi:hypothetical protein